MQITDGTTALTYTGTRMDDFVDIEQSSERTGGGELVTVRAGRRFIVSEGIRLTGEDFQSLIDLLMSGSEDYFYTPTVIPDYMDSTDFPMKVRISTPRKMRHVGGGDKKFYIELKMEGVSYL